MLAKLAPAAVAALLLISGCVSSENGLVPLSGGDRAVFDPALLGDWVLEPPKDQPFEPKPDDPKFIRIERPDPGSKRYRFVDPRGRNFDLPHQVPPEAYLVAIGKSLYLDVSLTEKGEDGAKRAGTARHFFSRVTIAANNLTMVPLSYDFFFKHPDLISTRLETGPNGRPALIKLPIITAPSAEIVAFLERSEADPELWQEGLESPHRWRRR